MDYFTFLPSQMKTFMIIRFLLAIHISGLVVMAGTTVIDYVTFRTFLESSDQGKKESRSLLPLMSKYGAMVRAGGAILLVSGLAMWALSDGVWQQLWFKIKIALVILLILNGALIGNKNGVAFRKMITENASDFTEQSFEVRKVLNRFYISQLFLFSLIILASSTKLGRGQNGN
jgi:hypothetical protein